MPTYVYRCKSCGYQVELVQKISEMKAPQCDKCSEEQPMETMLCATSFVLKGPGWAKDGYK